MKRIPLFLVLTLAAAWGYTSWYWYTCNIKGACQPSSALVESNLVKPDMIEEVTNVNMREQESTTTSTGEVQNLSKGDVLVGDSLIPQAAIIQDDEPKEIEENTSEETTGTGEVTNDRETPTGTGSAIGEAEITIQVQTSGGNDLCSNPLEGPISSGGANNSEEVIKLESFLIANAYLPSSDGIYGNADLEAVKQLQLDYKTQMLDPWGIDVPTGYVGSTTVATINSIGCNN